MASGFVHSKPGKLENELNDSGDQSDDGRQGGLSESTVAGLEEDEWAGGGRVVGAQAWQGELRMLPKPHRFRARVSPGLAVAGCAQRETPRQVQLLSGPVS